MLSDGKDELGMGPTRRNRKDGGDMTYPSPFRLFGLRTEEVLVILLRRHWYLVCRPIQLASGFLDRPRFPGEDEDGDEHPQGGVREEPGDGRGSNSSNKEEEKKKKNRAC